MSLTEQQMPYKLPPNATFGDITAIVGNVINTRFEFEGPRWTTDISN
jgi:hypothetical protein